MVSSEMILWVKRTEKLSIELNYVAIGGGEKEDSEKILKNEQEQWGWVFWETATTTNFLQKKLTKDKWV